MPIYKIANCNVKIDALYDRSNRNLEKYKTTEQNYDVDLSVNMEKYIEKNLPLFPHLDASACEYMILGTLFFEHLVKNDGIVLHSSAVVYNNKAYLFTAPSGTGKSTHASLWIKYLGNDKAKILNDDKPAIIYKNGNVYACGTPFSGKTDLNLNEQYPLGGICYISQSKTNKISTMTLKQSIAKILEQTHKKNDDKFMDMLFKVLDKIIPNVKCYSLECDISKEAFKTSFCYMTGETYE